MANSITFQDNQYQIGDMIDIMYRIKEGEKERQQKFSGILMKITGKNDATRMITARRISKSGIGVERILPLASPFIASIALSKKGGARRSKIYFIRELSDRNLRRKVFHKASTKKQA